MKTILRLLFAALLVGGWAIAALCVHVVRTPDKFVVVPKNRLHWRDTYVDARQWTADAAAEEETARRLVELGKLDRLSHVEDLDVRRTFPQQWNDAQSRGLIEEPTPPATP